MSNLSNKIALVTGASRGIGQAIALTLGKNGAYVIGTATSESGAQAISDYIHNAGLNGKGMVLDVTNEESINNLMQLLASDDKIPSILVNNAGITKDNLLLRMDDNEWDDVIDANLKSVFRMSRACVKFMFRARWGRIINIGSVVGSSGNPGQVNYTAAKAGIIGFSKSLAAEVASRGITVNVVAPGFIETDMTKVLPDLVKAELLKRIPMKCLGNVNDVAEVVAFLASDSTRYITGETIHVNGGMYMQ
jgi:3-oxoacyl-[acyl-carrier protein] reductase